MALATAKLFVAEGAEVFITGRRKEQLDKAVKEIGKKVPRNARGMRGRRGISIDCMRRWARRRKRSMCCLQRGGLEFG